MKIEYRKYVPALLFVLLLVLAALIVRPFFGAIFLGALLAYVFYPLHTFLTKRIKKPTISAILVCLLVLALLVVPAVFFVKTLVEESYVIYLVIKQKVATGIFTDCQLQFCQAIQEFGKNPEIQFQVQETLRTVTNWIIQKGSSFLLSIPRILLNVFIMFFLLFYGLLQGKTVVGSVSHYLQVHPRRYQYVITRLREIVHGLIYGYVLIALLQGALGALGFFLFGVPSPLFWGLVMALLALLPFLGTGFIWIPASAFLFLQGVFQNDNLLLLKGIGLFVYSFLFVGSVDNILRPKLVSGKAKVHPALILLGVFGGVLLFGPLGVLLGPLLLSLTAVLLETIVGREDGQS
ncbi:MAG TPA: AI-2E family transporter [Candidatus Nanoarchaeia archaeon]|nr:AI-2E family transporter [Candidatus Nanoarchaeia archaeon]